jgi:hypothetical protein
MREHLNNAATQREGAYLQPNVVCTDVMAWLLLLLAAPEVQATLALYDTSATATAATFTPLTHRAAASTHLAAVHLQSRSTEMGELQQASQHWPSRSAPVQQSCAA